MAIPKFVYAETKSGFNAVKENHFNNVVFIADSKEIYTHGIFYGISPTDLTSLQSLITAAQTAADNAQTAANGKVSNVTGGSAIEITTTGTAANGNISKAVAIKIDTTTAGNVTLSQGTNGLKGAVDLSDVENLVEGVATNEKIISLSSKKLASTLKIDYDSVNKKIQLKGIGDAVISELSATPFVKDGMLESVEIKTTAESGVTVHTPYLKFTFNTDSGQSVQRISMEDLVDVYDGANLNLSASYAAATTYAAPTSGDSMDTAIGKLAKGIANALVAGVTSIGGKVGAITLYSGGTANGTVNFSISEQGQISATVVGLGSAAYTESTDYATSTQGGYADSALQSISKGTDGTYVTTTVGSKTGNTGAKSQTVGVSVKTQAVNTSGASAKGLAEASDVKAYVDGLLTWVEIS
ncbi:MAG: hypothetical protein II937_13890 [Bacteroidales bacterium]|nr:hypothetical protein [Bacteroidales bacterium]